MSINNQSNKNKIEQKVLYLLSCPDEELRAFFNQPSEQLICFSMAVVKYHWELGKLFLDVMIQYQADRSQPIFPPITAGILGLFYEYAPSPKNGVELLEQYFSKIIEYHQYLYDNFDVNENGLIEKEGVVNPFFQSLLVWSNQNLIQIGQLLEKEVIDVILWNELSIYSCQEQLWDETGFRFIQIKNNQLSTPVERSHDAFLPLFGEVLTQEDAEELLIQMQLMGYPVDETGADFITDSSLNLLAPQAYILWLGLQKYDMKEAAECLETYLRYSLTDTQADKDFGYIKLLLENEVG